ncbi:MAG: hypothetical protein CL572_02890 [Alphaproteobacteria bacterium]|nr:hypothetical protein [Alphaproteobacteria bacterium]
MKLQKIAEQERIKKERRDRKALERKKEQEKKIKEKQRIANEKRVREELKKKQKEIEKQKKLMRIAQKEKNLENERERIKLLKEIEEKQKILEKKEIILQKQLENKEQIDEIKANIEDLKNKVKESDGGNDKLTQITVINKADLKTNTKDTKKNSDSISEIREDVSKIKRNIEDKLIRNELARQREEEIRKRKYSYFKDTSEKKEEKEDRTKLFYDENIIKKSFINKKKITENDDNSDDFKKKLQKKSLSDESNGEQNTKNTNLLSALNAPTSIVELKEQQVTKTSEVIIFNENEIELGFKHKKNVKEYVKAIKDKQIRVEIVASLPKNNSQKSKLKQKQKSRLLHVRTFLINQGISHNRIGIKFNEGNDSKNWQNEVVLNFIGL